MKSFEPVYKEMENLFINLLPEYIEKINKKYNDGIFLKTFANTALQEECIKTPSFILKIEDCEYSEKDRIIENTVYKFSLEIKLPSHTENKTILICRYYEAIEMTINNNEGLQECIITGSKENKVFIKITV